MTERGYESERRDGQERRREERRKQSIPVAVERRSGGDRRVTEERRVHSNPRVR